MRTVRLATVEDAVTIARHRRLMFADNFERSDADWDAMEQAFAAWVIPQLAADKYIGWFAEEDGHILAGAGVWLMEFPPHWMDVQPVRGYLLNFYTAPEARGCGLAKELLATAVEECKRRKIGVVTLHASRFGKPIYEAFGFAQNNEMLLRLIDGKQGWD